MTTTRRIKCWALALLMAAPCSGLAQNTVSAPEVPIQIEFAGEKFDLSRADLQERLDRELLSMSFGHINTILTIKRANRYLPVLSAIMQKEGIPADFVYMVAIESHYDDTALSPAGAAGMWQMMPATAKEYGLEVTKYVDERYDAEKAAVAACKYLKKAYAKYGNWLAVAASYNAGMRRISDALADQKADCVTDLYLNNETSRYIFRLFAMKTIMENPAEYGFRFKANQLYQPLECRKVTVSEPVESWIDWAHKHKISYALLRELNPWIRNESLPNPQGKTYKVNVPKANGSFTSGQLKTYTQNWVK